MDSNCSITKKVNVTTVRVFVIVPVTKVIGTFNIIAAILVISTLVTGDSHVILPREFRIKIFFTILLGGVVLI